MIVVVDTNVLVSALLSPYGPAARILELVVARELRMAYDDRILAEYDEVLNRRKFGFDPEDVGDILAVLTEQGVAVLARPIARVLPDPTDQAFLEVAAQAQAPLITGNRRHFPPELVGEVAVLAPAEFVAYWQQHQENDPPQLG